MPCITNYIRTILYYTMLCCIVSYLTIPCSPNRHTITLHHSRYYQIVKLMLRDNSLISCKRICNLVLSWAAALRFELATGKMSLDFVDDRFDEEPEGRNLFCAIFFGQKF